jgi:ABC-type phosphate transport system substrate-binding protein
VFVLAAAVASLAHAKQLALITDAANSTTDVTTADLVKIFNARMQNWPDGKPIRLIMRDPSAPGMHLVVRKLFEMNPEQVQSFLQLHSRTMVIADSDDAVVKLVSGTRGAIGVVDLFSITHDVKVLKIDGKLPVEQGYALRGNSQ